MSEKSTSFSETPLEAQVLDHKMYLQKTGKLSKKLLEKGIWEIANTKFSTKNISKGDVALDVGANIGYFTLLFAKLVGNRGKVFAFEPEPSNFEILKKNVKRNNYLNVELEQAAVADYNGMTKLFLSHVAAGGHSVIAKKFLRGGNISVKVTKLDDYFKGNDLFNKISFVKIDVEGAEFEVLKGMKKILEENKKFNIILEFNPSSIRKEGKDPLALLEFLESLGFDFYVQLKKISDKDLILQQYNNVQGRTLRCKKSCNQ